MGPLTVTTQKINSLFENEQDAKVVSDLVNATVSLESKVIQNTGFRVTPIIHYKDGKVEKRNDVSIVIPSYDPQNNLKMQIMLSANALNAKISDLKKHK